MYCSVVLFHFGVRDMLTSWDVFSRFHFDFVEQLEEYLCWRLVLRL